jgi:hypothetical protein
MQLTVVDRHGGHLDFVCGGRVIVQAQKHDDGSLVVGFVDRALLPKWSDVPSWYPCEAAIAQAIERSGASENIR